MSRALPCRTRVGAAAALLVISVAVGLAVARGGPASHGTVVIPPADVSGIDENSSTDPEGPRGTVTLAFAGDVHLQLHLAALLDHPSGALGPITQTLKAADVTMVNLESAITDRGTPEAKELEVASQRYYYRTSPAALGVLAAAGIDVVTMANNHGADYGTPGLRDSLAAIRASHFPVVGIGKDATAAYAPYTTTLNGVRVAIIGADQVQDETTLSRFSAGAGTPGVANAYSSQLIDAVRAAKRNGYVVIVYVHWGIEYQSCPSGDQQTLAAALAAAGATAVIGTHAHVLQGAGWRSDGTYVAYGLGNYLWWRTFGNAQDDNGVLTLTFRRDAVIRQSFAPSHLQSSGVSPPATGADRTRILGEWAQLRGCTDLSAGPPR
jgi:hypothetical protein